MRGLDSSLVTKVKGYSEAWAAPEVLQEGDKATPEADIFSFGMVVIEVSPRVSPRLALEVEEWPIHLTFEPRLRFSPGCIHSAGSQTQSSF